MPEVHIVGSLRYGAGFGLRSGYARAQVVAGEAWTLMAAGTVPAAAGGTDGTAGHGHARAGAQVHTHTVVADEVEDVLVFEHPIDVHYSCVSVCAWPQIHLSVWGLDAFGRNDVAGYGTVRVPACAGTHTLEVAMWRPRGSAMQEFAAWFRGGYPQLTDASVLTRTHLRHALETETTGTVTLELNVVLRGFDDHGVVFGGPPADFDDAEIS